MRCGLFALGWLAVLLAPVVAQPPPFIPADGQIPSSPGGQPGCSTCNTPAPGPGPDAGPTPVMASVQVESLAWWLRGTPLAFPLASRNLAVQTTNTAGLVSAPGSLDQTGTLPLHSPSDDFGIFLGGRVAASLWFDDWERVGADFSAFFLAPQTSSINAISDGSVGSVVLARPFFSPLLAQETALAVALPGLASGAIQIDSRLEDFWGVDAHLGVTLWRSQNNFVDFLFGGRYQKIKECLDVSSTSTFPMGNAIIATPFTLNIADQVTTRVRFYGGSLGLRGDFHWSAFRLQPSVKLGLGFNQQDATLSGSTLLTNGTTTASTTGGFLVQPSNRGVYDKTDFSVLTELGLNGSVQVTNHVRLTGGYQYLYWSNVPRPSHLLNRQIALAQQIPLPGFPGLGQNGPSFAFRSNDFWAHGLNAGIEFVY